MNRQLASGLMLAAALCAACSSGSTGSAPVAAPSPAATFSARPGATGSLTIQFSANYRRASQAARHAAFVDPTSGNLFRISTSSPLGSYAQPDYLVPSTSGNQANIPVPVFANTTNTITVNEFDSTGTSLLASGISSPTYVGNSGANAFTVTMNMIATQLAMESPPTGAGPQNSRALATNGSSPGSPVALTTCGANSGTYTFFGADALGGYYTGAGGTNFGLPDTRIIGSFGTTSSGTAGGYTTYTDSSTSYIVTLYTGPGNPSSGTFSVVPQPSPTPTSGPTATPTPFLPAQINLQVQVTGAPSGSPQQWFVRVLPNGAC